MKQQQIKPIKWKSSEELYWENPSEETYYLRKRWEILGLDCLLDLGCRNGRHALFFAEDGYTVTAYETENHDLHELKDQVNELGLEMTYLRGPLEHLSFDAQSYDAVLAYDSLLTFNQEQIEQVLEQLYRVLKTGGECYLTLPTHISLVDLVKKFSIISYKKVQHFTQNGVKETTHLLLKK